MKAVYAEVRDRIRRKAELKERGSGWRAVAEAIAERRKQKHAAESAPRIAGVGVEAVYAEARERNEDPLDYVQRATAKREEVLEESGRAVLLDDDQIARIRRKAELKERGSGWTAVALAISLACTTCRPSGSSSSTSTSGSGTSRAKTRRPS